MRRLTMLVVVLVVVLVALAGGLAFTAQPAECAWCGTLLCFESSDCMKGCACAMPFPDPSGNCVEVSQVPELRERGYRVLGEH